MNNKHVCHQIAGLCLVFFLLCQTGMSQPVHALPADPTAQSVASGPPLPRNETLYFNGIQWNSVDGWNPYSGGMNNQMVLNQQDSARITVFETPYMYNMLDGKQYPLLADGAWSWDVNMTKITFHIKAAAHWSDGTPVTAGDFAYTWATHIKYGTSVAGNYQDMIDNVTAVDPHTVVVRAKLDGGGDAINPLMVVNYLSSTYVIQKAWTKILEARTGGDPDAFKNDPAEDFVASGPYKKYFADGTKVVLIRDDNYWGKDATMWGKLPVPKYLAHVIYPDDDASLAAFKAGQVDVSAAFIADVQDLWLVDHLPISTYYADAPYHIGGSLPTAFYNLDSYGLDQLAVRKAIAMAVDYDKIIAEAMDNQSATFTQVPRSLMIPTTGEQAMYDHAAVASLQWVGNDIAGANAVLDTAGIMDTDADGWREYSGTKLAYTATCPNGWSDWQAAIAVIAEAGPWIGIDITTNYPEWSEYQTVVTNWPLTAGYDIFMMWSDATGPAEPWRRIDHLIGSEYAETTDNWNGNWGGYSNPAADALIQAIPAETDPVTLKDDYTQLVSIYLTDIPSFTLMYRPQSFHTVNESFWTDYPHDGDGTTPPVPPLNMVDGYSIAGLYNLTGHPTHTSTFMSTGTQDGWTLESSELSNVGATSNAAATTFSLGDEAGDRQYRSILSFNTAALPNTAVITKVTLKIKKQSQVGTNPFTILGALKADIRKPFFGATANLAASDFQAAVSRAAVGTFGAVPLSNWCSATINSLGYPYINKIGPTQFRLYFTKDDNDDGNADNLLFFSGNYGSAGWRPSLIVQYYVP